MDGQGSAASALVYVAEPLVDRAEHSGCAANDRAARFEHIGAGAVALGDSEGLRCRCVVEHEKMIIDAFAGYK
jgi:hypothetical protein